MVVAGAAGDSLGRHDFRDVIGGKVILGLPVRVTFEPSS